MDVTPTPVLAARSVSSAATITTRNGSDDASNPSESSLDDYSFGTSSIVRIAIVSGVIVLVITALVLFFKVSFHHTASRTREADIQGDRLDQILQTTKTTDRYPPTTSE